jgi:oligopeptidase A
MCLAQAFKHLVRDKKELEGLEPTTLAVAAQKAAAEGHKGATAEAGPWLLTLDYTTYSAVVSFAKNRDLREKMYRAYRRIGADAPSDNTDIIKQILKRRQQLAHMLGFKSYAEESFLSKVRNCWSQLHYSQSSSC